MITHLSRRFKASTAVVLIASFAVWHPTMMACMTAMPQGMEHPAHHQRAPQHHIIPPTCCRACVRTCETTQGLPTATAAVVSHRSIEYAEHAADRAGFVLLAAPHRLPFSIGPPLHLA